LGAEGQVDIRRLMPIDSRAAGVAAHETEVVGRRPSRRV
jgi:hypothetical protein